MHVIISLTFPFLADGYDETLIPVDFETAGEIRDDDLYKCLVAPMKKGVTVTCVFDCCHSGTVLDLPFRFQGGEGQDGMTEIPDFDYGKIPPASDDEDEDGSESESGSDDDDESGSDSGSDDESGSGSESGSDSDSS